MINRLLNRWIRQAFKEPLTEYIYTTVIITLDYNIDLDSNIDGILSQSYNEPVYGYGSIIRLNSRTIL